MRRHFICVLAVLTCSFLFGCHDDVVDPDQPRIVAQEIPPSALPAELDASRTYIYDHGTTTDPEGLLRWLWERGVHPRRAWQPIVDDSPCLLNLPNPSFTVELDAADARMLDYHFFPGTRQGLKCAQRFMSYEVLD